MSKRRILIIVIVLLISVNLTQADDNNSKQTDYFRNIWQQDTLTNGFWGLNDKLADSGVDISFVPISDGLTLVRKR